MEIHLPIRNWNVINESKWEKLLLFQHCLDHTSFGNLFKWKSYIEVLYKKLFHLNFPARNYIWEFSEIKHEIFTPFILSTFFYCSAFCFSYLLYFLVLYLFSQIKWKQFECKIMKKYIIGLTNDDLGRKNRTEEKCFQKRVEKLCSKIIMKSQVSIKSSIVS